MKESKSCHVEESHSRKSRLFNAMLNKGWALLAVIILCAALWSCGGGGGSNSEFKDIDSDSDGYTVNQGDCDDSNPLLRPYLMSIGADGNVLSVFPGQTITDNIYIMAPSKMSFNYEFLGGPQGMTVDNKGLLSYANPAEAEQGSSMHFQVRAIPVGGGCDSTLSGTLNVLTVENVATQTFGSAGGTLTDVQEEMIVSVPAGAVPDGTKITLTRGTDGKGNVEFLLESTAETDWINISLQKSRIEQAQGQVALAKLSAVGISKSAAIGSPLDKEWRTTQDGFLSDDERVPGKFQRRMSRLNLLRISWHDSTKLLSSLGPDDPAVSNKTPILFIHGYEPQEGFGGGDITWDAFPQKLQEDLGNSHYLCFEFRWRTNARFQDVASDLENAISMITEKTGKQVHIVAHSFGGLLARTYLQGFAFPEKSWVPTVYKVPVASITTIGTPHSGISASESLGDILGQEFNFPAGQDSGTFAWAGQVSVHQAGLDQTDTPSLDISDVLDNLRDENGNLYIQNTPGEAIVKLANNKFLGGGIPFQVLIGRGIECDDFGGNCQLRDGDGLISYEGQRFRDDQTSSVTGLLSGNLMNNNSVNITEWLLGSAGISLGDKGYFHTIDTARLAAPGYRFFQNIEVSVKADDDNHDGYIRVKEWIKKYPSSSGGYKLPDTGQTSCYDTDGLVINCAGTGQDGEYSINPMSFTDNGNGTVRDNVTTLIWQQADDAVARTWQGAIDYCDDLTLGGATNWRLPSRRELMSIVDYARYPSINPVFNGTTASYYWSSTPFAFNPENAWGVWFINGFVKYDGKAGSNDVRCVR